MTYSDGFNVRATSVKFNDVADAIDGVITRTFGGTTTGTSTAYIATPSPAWASYDTGASITIIPHVSNAAGSPSVTLNISGLGTKAIKVGGNDLTAGDLAIGIPAILTYTGVHFELGVVQNALLLDGSNLMSATGTAATPALRIGGDVNTGIYAPAADTWAVSTNGVERARVSSGGALLVGTTGSWGTIAGIGGSGALVISNNETNNTNKSCSIRCFTYNNSSHGRFALIAGSSALNENNILIGTGGDSAAQEIRFFTQANPNFADGLLRAKFTSTGEFFINTTSNFSADKMCLAFDATQNGLGIRDNNNTSGTTFAVFRNSTNGICGSVTRVGTTNAVNYNTSSDYRLKKDVQPIENALAKLNQINPVKFAWKDCDVSANGFIAHELAAVLPDAVSGEKDAVDAEGNPIYQGADYGKLTPILTAAIQELSAEVEALKAEIAELKK